MAESMQFTARPPRMLASPEEGKVHNHYLIFSLGGESLAMEARFVKEILQYGNITEVPVMPPVIRGVINLRGTVVPVIDLAVRFSREAATTDKRTCIVIVEVEEEGEATTMGIVVDHVSEVLEIPESDIEPTPTFGSRFRADFLRGVGKIGGRFVTLLDIERVLSAKELGEAEYMGSPIARSRTSALAC